MKAGDKVIYFQPKGFDTPVHRTATITNLTESQIDGKRAFRAARQHDVRITILDHPRRIADRVRAG